MSEDPNAWNPGIINRPWDEEGKANTGVGVKAILPTTPKPQDHVTDDEVEKVEEQEETVPRGRRRRYYATGIVTALLVVAAASVVAVFFAGDTPMGGEPQGGGSSSSSSVVGHPASSRERAFRDILKNISGALLLEQDSPQERALQWLVWHDPAKLEPQDDDEAERQIQERYILAVVYFALHGAEWLDSFAFLSEAHVCDWNTPDFGMGVTCEEPWNHNHTVQAIQIGPNNLVGTLPEETFLLQGLTSFQIVVNPGLTGPIPSTVGTLTQLQILNLNKNSFTGVVPDSLLQLPSLTTLWMDGNSLEGSYPPIGDNSRLQWWSCKDCGLQGEIPETVQYPPEYTLLSHKSS